MPEAQEESLILSQEDPPGKENSSWLHSSCLENPTSRGAWMVTVLGVTEVRHIHTEIISKLGTNSSVKTSNAKVDYFSFCSLIFLLRKGSGNGQRRNTGIYSIEHS